MRVYCKKSYDTFILGNWYECKKGIFLSIVYNNNINYSWFDSKKVRKGLYSYPYFSKYFLTQKELRQLKLNKIESY